MRRAFSSVSYLELTLTGKAEPNDSGLLIITTKYNELSLQHYLDQVYPVETTAVHLDAEAVVDSWGDIVDALPVLDGEEYLSDLSRVLESQE